MLITLSFLGAPLLFPRAELPRVWLSEMRCSSSSHSDEQLKVPGLKW